MIKTYKNINISVGYQCFCMKASEQGLFYPEPVKMSLNSGMLWFKTYKNINISAGYQCFCMEPSEQGLFLLSQSKWVQIVVSYNWNWEKHKYLSRISTYLHKIFRTGLISPSWSKWVQIVVCYDWNLQKHKYLSGISMFLHETFRTGLVYLSLVEMSLN